MIPSTNTRPIVFVCIGTDRSTGDSLGPLIGTLLEEKSIHPFHVYGTLDHPIHALNLAEKLIEIKDKTSSSIHHRNRCLLRKIKKCWELFN